MKPRPGTGLVRESVPDSILRHGQEVHHAGGVPHEAGPWVRCLEEVFQEGRDGHGQVPLPGGPTRLPRGHRHAPHQRQQDEGGRDHPAPSPPHELPDPVGEGRGLGRYRVPAPVRPHVVGQGSHVGVALPGIGSESLQEDPVQVPPEAAGESRLRRRAGPEAGRGDVPGRLRRQGPCQRLLPLLDRPASREQLVEDRAEGVDVGGGGEHVAPDLLRGSVFRSHDPEAGAGDRVGSRGVEDLGDAEVEELRLPPRRDQDVRRLQVPVDHQRLVGMIHGVADLQEEVQSLIQGEAPVPAVLVDGPALDVLHHDEGAPVPRLPGIVEAGDVGVFELGQDPSFHGEPPEEVRRVEPGMDELEGHDPVRDAVSPCSGEDGAHPPAPHGLEEPVGRHVHHRYGEGPASGLVDEGGEARGGGLQRRLLPRVLSHELQDLPDQLRVIPGPGPQRGLPLLRREVHHLLEELPHPGPAVRVHPVSRLAGARPARSRPAGR